MTSKDTHTCHTECQRLECVQAREIEKLREIIRLIKVAASTKHGALQKDGILKLIDGGER